MIHTRAHARTIPFGAEFCLLDLKNIYKNTGIETKLKKRKKKKNQKLN